jgi:hypothetical protein
MATTLIASMHVHFQAVATKGDGRSGTGSVIKTTQLANGTEEDEADKAYHDERTIAYTSTPDNLDFAGGGLIDLNGDTITWVDMVGLAVHADEDNEGDILVGAASSNPFNFGIGTTATMRIKPGETKVLINVSTDPGYAISAGSADTIKIAADTGVNLVYEILAIGRSA